MNIDEIINSLISEEIGTSTRKKIYDSIINLMPNTNKLYKKVPKLLALLKNTEKSNEQSTGITDVKALNIAIKKIDILTNTFNKLAEVYELEEDKYDTEVYELEEDKYDNAFFVKVILKRMDSDTSKYESCDIFALMNQIWESQYTKVSNIQVNDDYGKDDYAELSQTLKLLLVETIEFYKELFIGGNKEQRINKIDQLSNLTIEIIKFWRDSCQAENKFTAKDKVDQYNAINFFYEIKGLSKDQTIHGLNKSFDSMKNHEKHQCWLAMKLHNQPPGQCSLAEYIATHPYESKGIDSEGETTRASSPASSISSLSDGSSMGRSTTGPDDYFIRSRNSRSASPNSSATSKNTGNTTSSDKSSVHRIASMFEQKTESQKPKPQESKIHTRPKNS